MTGALVVHPSDVGLERWDDPVRGRVGFRTLLGGPGSTISTGGAFTAGVCELEPAGWLGHHRHQPSEVYHVLEGAGTLTVDGVDHAVTAGTTAWVPGDSEHGIRTTGPATLRFFYAFAVGSFEDVVYRFTAAG